MIVDNFYAERISLAKLKADPPGAVDGHGPLTLAIILELVEPTLFKGLKSFKDVAASSTANRSRANSASSPRNFETLPFSANWRIAEFFQDLVIPLCVLRAA
jgi:hypothetical protein